MEAPAPVRATQFGDLVAVGGAKVLVETLSARYGMNSTPQSGVLKLIGAYLVNKYSGKNKILKYLAMGLAIDGIEDIWISVLPMVTGRVRTATEEVYI